MVRQNVVRCGTPSGYRRHQRQGEKPCDACVAAKSAYDKRWRAASGQTKKNRLHARAQNQAEKRLRNLYPEVYEVLYEEELKKAYEEHGLAPPPPVRSYRKRRTTK